jgi:polyisoprenoid-binding protein YceI
LDAASIDTGAPKRDADVRSPRYLDSSTYPEITFACRQLRCQDGNWIAAGTVTAHGTAAPVDLTLADLTHDAGNLRMRATARIDRYAHEVTTGKGMAARWRTVEITALATPQKPRAVD